MPWNCHNQWRDCKAWEDFGLPVSTTSNEAAKMLDAAMTQYMGFYEDETIGGIKTAMEKTFEADPEFVLAHAIGNSMTLLSTDSTPRVNPELKQRIDTMVALASKADLNQREKLHVRAVEQLANEDVIGATLTWEEILLYYPLDAFAIKQAYFGNFYQGKQAQLRDCVARVLPYWKKDMPLYGFLRGMYAFGLCETQLYSQAEEEGRKALEMNSRDAWATHSIVHVMEMQGRFNEGIDLLNSTVKDWSSCGYLSCHNYWHWAVYNIEKGNYEEALGLYDTEVGARTKKDRTLFQITDACSMLCRLELQDVNVGDRWQDMYEVCRPHLEDHIVGFDDIHILMACLGSKQEEGTKKMMDSLREILSNPTGSTHVATKDVWLPLCESFVAYDEGDFAKAVDLLLPVRYNLHTLAGSDAQRDVFAQFLISACLKSPENRHNRLARQLLMERKATKENSPLTDRFIAKAMAQHID